jgi:hypothetical protein
MADVRVRDPAFKDRIRFAVIELMVLAAAWYFLKLDPPLVGALAVVFIVSAVVPGRWGIVASGVGMLGVAALVEFYYGFRPLAIVLVIFGLLSFAGLFRRGAPPGGGA